MKPDNRIRNEFLIEQYRQLRHETIERTRLDYQNQRNGTLAIGALITIWATNPGQINLTLILLGCVVISWLTYEQQRRHKTYGIRIGVFHQLLEKEFIEAENLAGERPLGWEHFLTRIRDGKKTYGDTDPWVKRRNWLSLARNFERVFWAFSAASFLTIAIVDFFL